MQNLQMVPVFQWPCEEQYPDGTHHICKDGVFSTATEHCKTYGHLLDTGATVSDFSVFVVEVAGPLTMN